MYSIKDEQKNLSFDDIEISKGNFNYFKHPIDIKNINIDIILISKKVSFNRKGFIHFVGYKDDNKINPLCIMLPKMGGYAKSFVETKYMSFLIEDFELIKNMKKCGIGLAI